MKLQRKDIVGQKYGKLTVVSFDSKKQHNFKCGSRKLEYWLCECECGNTKIVCKNSLFSGATTSCGCLAKAMYARKSKELQGLGVAKNALGLGEAAWNDLYSRYQYNAKVKNLIFTLTKDEFKILCLGSCAYCGVKPYKEFPTYKHRSSRPVNGLIIVNGIDRIDSSFGYQLDNCSSSCEICNKSKRDLSNIEWCFWIDRISHFNKGNYGQEQFEGSGI